MNTIGFSTAGSLGRRRMGTGLCEDMRFAADWSQALPKSAVLRVLSDGARVRIDDDQVDVRDSEGRLLVRYRDGHAEIAAPSGDLVLAAPEGEVVVRGAGVRVEADCDLSLSARATSLRTSAFQLIAEHIVEKAEDVVREISGRLMTKAERLRTIVSGAAIMTAERTEIRSEQETAIDGSRVLLG